jgi:murein peptide amidase A
MSYTGETLDVRATLNRLHRVALSQGFEASSLCEQDGFVIPIYTRAASKSAAKRVYLSAGIHGDEPAGPLAALDLLETDSLSSDIDWTLFPLFNPVGLSKNQRENHQGIDLNRDYKTLTSIEVQSHVGYIETSPVWDLALMIHEDWESEGFYLYDAPTELTQGWAMEIVAAVSQVCPIDLSNEIDEMKAEGGIITPDWKLIDEDPKLSGQWAEAIYMHMTGKIKSTYTFEAPSSFDLQTRIKCLKTAILTSIELLKGS